MKEVKEFIIKRAEEKSASESELKKVREAETIEEIKRFIIRNVDWCRFNDFITDQECLKHFGVVFNDLVNSGYRNSGIHNSGNCNSGDRNSGYWNSGDWNTGSRNSGYRNSGDQNSGDQNSGDQNSGSQNSGDQNSGCRNSGYGNSGYWNSGDWNTGDYNSGDYNSGDWNSGNWNNGFFNTNTPEFINVFNQPCKKSDWNNAKKPSFIYFNLNVWVCFDDMSEEEKQDNPNASVLQGYLKTRTYKQAWKDSYDNASEEDINLLKALPNFDPEVFKEISGIDVNEEKLNRLKQ